MQFKISKLQEGGNISAPYVGYTPFFQPTQQPEASSETISTTTKEDNTNKQLKDLIGSIAGKGLNNEVNYFADKISSLFMNAEMLGEPVTVRQYASIVAQLNTMQNNKAIYDEAKKEATSKGTLSEAAITYEGNFYAQDKYGQLKMITPEQYNSNKDKYKLLTNSDLLNLRNNSQAFIFDNTISQTIAGSLSMSDINKEIYEAISKIQKEDSSSDLYINKLKAQQFNDDLQAIVQNNLDTAPDNLLYKVTSETSTQRNHLNTALVRIWNNLSQHTKNTLIAQAAINEDGNPRQNAYKALADILTYGTYQKQSISIKDEGELDSSGKKGSSGSSSTKSSELGAFEIYAGDRKTKDYTIKLGTKYSLTTKANIAPLVDFEGKVLNENYLSDILTTGGLSALVNPEGATLGTDEVLNPMDFSKIIYGNDQIATAWLPAKVGPNGVKIVDLDVLNRIQKADDEIKNLNNPSEEKKKEIYNKYEVLDYYMLDPKVPTAFQKEHMKQFMIIPSYIPEAVMDKIDIDKLGLNRLSNAEEEEVFDLYDRIKSKYTNKETRSSAYKPFEAWYWEDDDVYKTSVFIPLSDNIAIRQIAGGNAPTVPAYRFDFGVTQYNQENLDNPRKINTEDPFK